jgi:hypothetical protein
MLTRYETAQAILNGKSLTRDEMFKESVTLYTPLGQPKTVVLTEKLREKIEA